MMTEDCLYLNIYTKNLIKRNSYDYEVGTNQMLNITHSHHHTKLRCSHTQATGSPVSVCPSGRSLCSSLAMTFKVRMPVNIFSQLSCLYQRVRATWAGPG